MIRNIALIAAGVVIGAGGVTLGQQPRAVVGAQAVAAPADIYKNLSLFGDVYDRVRTEYVEKPNEQKMVEAAINGMLSSLDPHSSYLNDMGYKDTRTQIEGKFGGLGFEVMQEDGGVTFVPPIDDTPASRAGILSGDLIVGIDDERVQGLTFNRVVDKMRGAVNTNVKLTILRGKEKQKLDIKLTRAEIHINSVKWRTQADDIGYIRISQFNGDTAKGLKTAMQKFQQDIPNDKFKGYILDLRNNPGGLLDQSIQVVNSFIDHGEIVSTRGRSADDTQRYSAHPGDLSKGKPVVVLINGGSASASEIVAGALQDHRRATLIGTRSFGKGSVQTIIPLGGTNGALRLTTARYYTPSGRSIQAKGIEPDITLLQDMPDNLKGQDDTKGEASLKGHLMNGEDEKSGSQAYVPPEEKDDKQLIEAVELLHSKPQAQLVPPAARKDGANKSEKAAN
jgi:carboxyl-terminal processing protease